MFGSKKKKIQVKSVEDFLKGEDARVGISENRPANGTPVMDRMKPFAAQAIVVFLILAVMFTLFAQLSALRSEVAELKSQKDGDANGVKLQVAELAAKLEKSTRQVVELTENVSTLQQELESERASRVRAAAVVRKPPVADKKKVPKPHR